MLVEIGSIDDVVCVRRGLVSNRRREQVVIRSAVWSTSTALAAQSLVLQRQYAAWSVASFHNTLKAEKDVKSMPTSKKTQVIDENKFDAGASRSDRALAIAAGNYRVSVVREVNRLLAENSQRPFAIAKEGLKRLA